MNTFEFPNTYQAYTQFIESCFSQKNLLYNGPNFYSGSTVYTAGVVVTHPSWETFDSLLNTWTTVRQDILSLLSGEALQNKKGEDPEATTKEERIVGILDSYPKITVNSKGYYSIAPFTFQYKSNTGHIKRGTTTASISGSFLDEIYYSSSPASSYAMVLNFNTIEGDSGYEILPSESIRPVTLDNVTPPSLVSYELTCPIAASVVDTSSITVVEAGSSTASVGKKVTLDELLQTPLSPTLKQEAVKTAIYAVLASQQDCERLPKKIISREDLNSGSGKPPQVSDEDLVTPRVLWRGYPIILWIASKKPTSLSIKFQFKNENQPTVEFKVVDGYNFVGTGSAAEVGRKGQISPLVSVDSSLVKEVNLLSISEYANAVNANRIAGCIPVAFVTTPASAEQQVYLNTLQLTGYRDSAGVQTFPLPTSCTVRSIEEKQKAAVARDTVLEKSSLYSDVVSTGIQLPYTFGSLYRVDLGSIKLSSTDGTILYKEGQDYTFTHSGIPGSLGSSQIISARARIAEAKLTYRKMADLSNTRWGRVAANMVPGLDALHVWLITLKERSESYNSQSSGLVKQFSETITAIERIFKVILEVINQVQLVIDAVERLIIGLQQLNDINIYVLYAHASSTQEIKSLYTAATGLPQKDTLYYWGGIAVFGSESPSAVMNSLSGKYNSPIDALSSISGDFTQNYVERSLQLNPEVGTAINQIISLIKTYSKGVIN